MVTLIAFNRQRKGASLNGNTFHLKKRRRELGLKSRFASKNEIAKLTHIKQTPLVVVIKFLKTINISSTDALVCGSA